MKKWTTLAAIAALVFAGSAFACDGKAQLVSGKADNAIDAAAAKVLNTLPHLVYRVGEFETPCIGTATTKAGESGTIQYKVGDATFDCRGKAMARMAADLEDQAAQMLAVAYSVGGECFHCPTTAKTTASDTGQKLMYRLAGFDFATRGEANAVAKIVSEAVAGMAQTASSKENCCGKCGGAKTAGKSGCSKSCSKTKAQTASGKKDCCGKCGGDKAASKAGCSKSCSKTKAHTASGKKDCCGKCGGDKTAAKAGCSKSCGKCGGDKAAGKSGCSKSCAKTKAQTASARSKCSQSGPADCCTKADSRVDAAMDKLELIVRSAAAARTSIG